MLAPVTDPATVVAPRSSLASALARHRARLPRLVLIVGLLCLAIAVLLTTIDGGKFHYKLLYSLCIGTACSFITEAGRLAQAAFADLVRSWRGMPVGDAGFGYGWRGVVPAAALAMLLGPSVGLSLGDALTGFKSPSLLRLGDSNTRLTLAFSILGTIVCVSVLSTLERLSTAKAQAEAAQRQAAENQLQLLQSQLEPHMLFNTLANLRVLIGIDTERAQAMLDRLIAFLRATLNASRQPAHALSAEFAHLDDYLALMGVRMGPRLQVQFDLPPALGALPVPPLLLQPLVENAIKHGLEPKVEGGRIRVSAHREGHELRLVVRDTGVGLNAAGATAGTSFGLEQVRARLATLYGPRASLSLVAATDAEGGVQATVCLPLSAA